MEQDAAPSARILQRRTLTSRRTDPRLPPPAGLAAEEPIEKGIRMSVMRMLPLTLLSLAVADPSLARDESGPPTRVDSVADTYHGVRVPDPYRWLENGSDPAVRAWTAQQSARTRTYLDALPVRARLHERLEKYISESSPRYYTLRAAGGGVFAMYFDPARQQPSLRLLGPELDPAKARTVLDPNLFDASGATAIDWYVPSPDGRLVAVSLSKGGSEDGSLHLFETDTGKQVGEVIPRVNFPTAGGDLAWSADGKGFWYTRYPGEERPEADRHFYVQVYFHALGSDPARDRRVFGDGLPKVAEIQLDYSRDAGALLISVQDGDGGEFAHWVSNEAGGWTQVTRFKDGVDFAAFGPDRALYLVSEREAPRRQVLRLAPGVTDLARASVLIPAGEDAIPIDFFGEDPLCFVGDRLYVHYLAGGPSRLRAFTLDGKPAGEVALPDIAAVGEMEALGGDLLYSVETYLAPNRFYRLSDERSAPTALAVTSPVKFDDVEVVRAFAISKDGARIPVNIVRRKGTRLDGSNPTLLYGYGGYGVSQTPSFLGGSRRVWFDAGGVYAIANIRGGGEYGEEWHRQGMLTRKQNVFDDFIAAAELLVKENYTRPAKLAIRGGSNGGLLMGAALTQRPDLFRAVVAQVAIFDMLRVELDPNGEFNVTEFGTVKDPEQFRALYGYSPYHRVRDGVKYPAVFMSTGENDGRVNPANSRKMAARLQAATTSGLPIFLVTTDAAGHGMGSPLSVQIDQMADYLAFLFDQLGMTLP
jgi:prolyl oligopeptidase